MTSSTLSRLLVGWLFLTVAWAIGNPPLAAPDERDHYVRVVGIAEGHLVGAPAPWATIGANPAEIRFDKETQRAVWVPARLDPTPFDCYLGNPAQSAACLNRSPRRGSPARLVTTVGVYPPLGLLAPAFVVRAASGPLQAVRLGRLASLAVALTLLSAAAWALFESAGGWLSLVGLLAACTPTALFLAASITPSGLEVSAGIALSAALLRLTRRSRAPAGVWALLGVSGAALTLSHPTGLAWALALLIGFVVWTGPREVRALVRREPVAASAGFGIFAAGVLSALVWQTLYGASTPIAWRALRLALSRVPSQYWGALRDLVAGFGYLEFRAPLVYYLLWFGFVAAIMFVAIRLADRRQRRTVLIAGALAFILPVGVWIASGRAAGIGMSAREYMPVLVACPLLAGEVLYRNRTGISHRGEVALAGLAGMAGLLQFTGWYLNARRAAVGVHGKLLFLDHPAWSPPLGWWFWALCAATGALLLCAVPVPRRLAPSPRPWRAQRGHPGQGLP